MRKLQPVHSKITEIARLMHDQEAAIMGSHSENAMTVQEDQDQQTNWLRAQARA